MRHASPTIAHIGPTHNQKTEFCQRRAFYLFIFLWICSGLGATGAACVEMSSEGICLELLYLVEFPWFLIHSQDGRYREFYSKPIGFSTGNT